MFCEMTLVEQMNDHTRAHTHTHTQYSLKCSYTCYWLYQQSVHTFTYIQQVSATSGHHQVFMIRVNCYTIL
jgi:hypothetical protein